MKADQRKELQTNSLVRFIGRLKQNFKGAPSRKATVIWGIVVLALVVFIGWKIASSLSTKNNSRRWVELDSLAGADELNEFIDKNRGTVQAHVARLQIARADLEKGLEDLYDPLTRDSALEKLKNAAGDYEELAKQFKATPVLVQECLFGAGKAYEGMGDLDRAREFYTDLQNRFKDSTLAAEAEGRLRNIEKSSKDLAKLNEKLKKGDPVAAGKDNKEK
jgi:tetratricopeptide (TPR) repeat protein